MDYEQRLIIAMQQISHNFKRVIADSKETSKCELSVHDCRLVEFIGNKTYTLNEIAKQFQVTPGTMSGHIERLVSQEILTRRRDESDRRKTYISLSKKGFDYYKLLNDKLVEFSKKTLKKIPKEKQQELIELFENMAGIELE